MQRAASQVDLPRGGSAVESVELSLGMCPALLGLLVVEFEFKAFVARPDREYVTFAYAIREVTQQPVLGRSVRQLDAGVLALQAVYGDVLGSLVIGHAAL